MSLKCKVFLGLCLLLLTLGVAVVGLLFGYLWAGREVHAGYSAKILASGVFVAGRSPESVVTQELAIVPFLKYTVDREDQTVTAWISNRYRKTAVYRDGLGVALAHDGDVAALKGQARPELLPEEDAAALPWPQGNEPSGNPRPGGYDEVKLAAVVDGFFGPPKGFLRRHTRAIVVVYKDEIIAEQYAEGFDADQRFPAWSMTKSVTHALYGLAVHQGKLAIDDAVPFWQSEDDARSAITLDMLLRMSSGLDFSESYFNPYGEPTTMLFLEPGAGHYAATRPLKHVPDTVWAYTSATTNLLSLVLRHVYGDAAYYALPYQELFHRIGMNSAVIEADAAGTYVGSSFMHATARDYARFGMLYLHDGVWQGERILPEGWSAYARAPTPTAPDANYGAHWWLVGRSAREQATQEGWTVPEDVFFAAGYEGQFIVVIPSRELVLVQLSLDLLRVSPLPLIRSVLEAFDS